MIPNVIMQIMNMNPRMKQAIQNMQNINTPDSMAQYLLNSGMVNQSQVNQAKQMWGRPNIRDMVLNRFKF